MASEVGSNSVPRDSFRVIRLGACGNVEAHSDGSQSVGLDVWHYLLLTILEVV